MQQVYSGLHLSIIPSPAAELRWPAEHVARDLVSQLLVYQSGRFGEGLVRHLRAS